MLKEEKIQRLTEILTKTKTVFILKEIEQLGKQEGIVLNSIEGIIQELVDEGKVMSEKIGNRIYFWLWRDVEAQRMAIEQAKQQEDFNTLEEQIKSLSAELDQLEQNKPKDTTDLVQMLQQLNEEVDTLQTQVKTFEKEQATDFGKIEQELLTMTKDCQVVTDNLFAIQKFCRDKFNMSSKDVQQQLGIPQDLDYL
ncbi:meiotic nuclear division protein 1 [Gorgonomyces haynaldii]|nr:meiotic nuclear division protein 1 [Gorgonomyces haynaldii]